MKLLSEKWKDTIDQFGIPEPIDIYINPTSSEIQEALRANKKNEAPYPGAVRLFLTKGGMGDVYMWSSRINHNAVWKRLRQEFEGFKGDVLPAYLLNKGKSIAFSYWSLNDDSFSLNYSKKEAKEKIKNFWAKNIKANKNVKRFMSPVNVSAKDPNY